MAKASHHATGGAAQDAAVAALVRVCGVEDEQSAVVQAKLRAFLPSLVVFVAGRLADDVELAIALWLLERLEQAHALPKVAEWLRQKDVGKLGGAGASGDKGIGNGPRQNDVGELADAGASGDKDVGDDAPEPARGDQESPAGEKADEGATKAPLQPCPPTSPCPHRSSAEKLRESRHRNSTKKSLKESAAFAAFFDDPAAHQTGRAPPDIGGAEKLELVKGIFSGLDDDTLGLLAGSFRPASYAEHETVSSRDGMHILVRGQGRISVPLEVGMLAAGESFGDRALLMGLPVLEQLEAHGGELVTLKLAFEDFDNLDIRRHMITMNKQKRGVKLYDQGEGAQPEAAGECEEAAPPSEEDRGFIADSMMRNTNLDEVLTLSKGQCELMAKKATKKVYKKGQTVFNKGAFGDAFYIVAEGTFKLFIDGVELYMSSTFKPGDSFGELALLYDAPRAMTIKCHGDGSLWKISKAAFKTGMDEYTEMRMKEYTKLIDSVPLFKNIDDEDKKMFCNAFEELYCTKDQDVVSQGDVGDSFFIIFEGTCNVIKDGKVMRELTVGDHFGERALLADEPRSATVRVLSDDCMVLLVDRISFSILKDRVWSRSRQNRFKLVRKHTSDLNASSDHLGGNKVPKAIKKESLERVGFLGQGSFGFVTLERNTTSGKLYALKAMSKGQIAADRIKGSVLNEVACMKLMESDFIVRLRCTYRDATGVYLLLEPCFGGELFDVYHAHTLWGSETHARYYAASVTFALEHMHERKVVFRDLKMENCLLTVSGRLKLTDFGIAKVVLGKTFSLCGTADYFAPETLRQKGHNRAVDWWALGILIFIMMTGRSPFNAQEVMQVYKNIVKGFASVTFPADVPGDCVKLIKALCQKKPEERLTMKPGGTKNLKDHPWFEGFDWAALSSGGMVPPWSSDLSEEGVAERVAKSKHEEPPQFHYEDDGTNWDADFDWTTSE